MSFPVGEIVLIGVVVALNVVDGLIALLWVSLYLREDEKNRDFSIR